MDGSVAGDHDVEVLDLTAQQPVADGAADEPCPLVAERLTGGVERRAHRGSPSRWC